MGFQRRPGVNLIEVLVAAVIAGVVMLALGNFIGTSLNLSGKERERTFAQQKALQMLEELSAYQPGPNDPGLDKFADGLQFKLTTVDGVSPIEALSANPRPGGAFKYVRDILVEGVTGDPFARKVTVRVWYADRSLQNQAPPVPAAEGKPLAVVSNVLRSNVAKVGPVHVLDVFVVSIENVPHIMRNDDDIYHPSADEARRNFEAAVRTVEAMNPWLDLNLRYITRLSVGRDPYYRPYVNAGLSLDKNPSSTMRDPLDRIYFYPGQIGQDAGSPFYYHPGDIAGKVGKGDSAGGSTPQGSYPLADQFNHAVRYPLEFNGSQPLQPSGTAVTKPEEMSLRQFLEDMLNDTTGKYRNAMVVNLHGELLPVLPLRNWSDPAKDLTDTNPDTRKRRLVTHPLKLNTPTSESIKLLVHPFMADGSDTKSVTGNNAKVQVDPALPAATRKARIIIKDLKPDLAMNPDLNDWVGDKGFIRTTGLVPIGRFDVFVSTVHREKSSMGAGSDASYWRGLSWPRLHGTPNVFAWPNMDGVMAPLNSDEAYHLSPAHKAHSGPHVGTETKNSTTHGSSTAPNFSGDDFIVELSDLDFDARQTNNGSTYYGIRESSGLPDRDYLLHQLQYFPDPYLPMLDAQHTGGQFYPRSTARAIIEFNLRSSASGKRFEVITQLMKADGTWAPLTSNDPTISRTWFYSDAGTLGTDGLYRRAGDLVIPWTEQLQLVGDPRHNPYLDFRKNDLYNPFFAKFVKDDEVYKNLSHDESDPVKHLDVINPYVPAGDRPPQQTSSPVSWNIKFPRSDRSWSGVKYNAPAYFRLWREALLRNDMAFVSLTGEPIRFLGLGGEFTLHRKVNGIGDLQVSGKPWGAGSGDADQMSDELLADGGANGRAPFIERQSDKWYAKPWLGELYPADYQSSWVTNGNLPSGTFWRERISDVEGYDYAADRNNNDHNDFNNKRIFGNVGLASFLNGESTPDEPLRVDFGGSRAELTSTGRQITRDLRLSLQGRMSTEIGYKLTGGNEPPEWDWTPYVGFRKLLTWLNPGDPSGVYSQNQGGDYYAVNSMLLSDDTASDPRRALVVASTLRPNTAADVGKVLEAAVASMVGAHFDGTRNSLGAHNVKPLPRVKITEPESGTAVTSNIALTWYARWVRSDGNAFSPFHTYDPAAASSGATTIVHFVKLQNRATGVWTMAGTGTPTAPGLPGAAAEEVANQAYPAPITANYNVSALDRGEYLVRVEAHRKIGSTVIGGNYAYHELALTLN